MCLKIPGRKQPYYFSRGDGRPVMLAGIWEDSEYKGDRRVAFAILTDEPNGLVAPYHDRMPLALADEAVDAWLDLAQPSPLDVAQLLDLAVFTKLSDIPLLSGVTALVNRKLRQDGKPTVNARLSG